MVTLYIKKKDLRRVTLLYMLFLYIAVTLSFHVHIVSPFVLDHTLWQFLCGFTLAVKPSSAGGGPTASLSKRSTLTEPHRPKIRNFLPCPQSCAA